MTKRSPTPLPLLVTLVVLLGAVVASGVVGLRALGAVSAEFRVADRPAAVYRTLGTLLSAAQDLETGERGYILSGNDEFLEPYQNASIRIDPILARLDTLVSWNPVQVARMPVLRRQLAVLQAHHARVIETRRDGDLAAAVSVAEQREGMALMDSVRSSIDVMQEEAARVRGLREQRVVRANRAARRSIWVSSALIALGLLLAALVAWRAIRYREQWARELAATNDALSQALAEREAALHRVHTMQGQLVQEGKLAGLGRLTAGVAHELKNPLNFVTNFAALADEMADEAEQALRGGRQDDLEAALLDLRANTQRVVEHADRADQIVRSMLTHAQGVTGTRQPVNLSVVLDDAVAYALGVEGGEGAPVDIHVEAPDGPVVVEGVPLALGRLFQNLISNAVYAVRERDGLGSALPGHPYAPLVTIRVRVEDDRTGGAAVVEVEDNGAGIPEADVARVFEPFFTTKGPGQGTGLGLPLAHDIAVGHGGSLTAGRATGGGARFTVRLPLRAPAEAGASETTPPAPLGV